MLAREAGPQAKVLVDTGHHYLSQNIEQIVAWLLDEEMLGGFHFNDRRYADDDLTMGSIDPYQIFRIFHEIRFFEWERGGRADIAYVVDQSHNLKGKIEAMLQTVMNAQELYAKAAIVDHERLVEAQRCHRSRARRVVLAGCVQDRCARRHHRVATGQAAARRSARCLPSKRISRAHHRGPGRAQRVEHERLRVSFAPAGVKLTFLIRFPAPSRGGWQSALVWQSKTGALQRKAVDPSTASAYKRARSS